MKKYRKDEQVKEAERGECEYKLFFKISGQHKNKQRLTMYDFAETYEKDGGFLLLKNNCIYEKRQAYKKIYHSVLPNLVEC